MTIYITTSSIQWQYILQLPQSNDNIHCNFLNPMTIYITTSSIQWQYILQLLQSNDNIHCNFLNPKTIYITTSSIQWQYILQLPQSNDNIYYKNKIYHHCVQRNRFNQVKINTTPSALFKNLIEKRRKDFSKHTHDHSCSWIGTGTLIKKKAEWLKLVLWAQSCSPIWDIIFGWAYHLFYKCSKTVSIHVVIYIFKYEPNLFNYIIVLYWKFMI
jgi:hypothetical protein